MLLIIPYLINVKKMRNYKWFRKFIGGVWFKYEMTGELPGCYGHLWSKKIEPSHRYYIITEIEEHEQW